MAKELKFWVNGNQVELKNPRPELTLLQYLRSSGLTGTKLGCAEGGCGASSHSSVNACLAPLCSLNDKHVITVEGIGNSKSPHPVQERIAQFFGSQCGFCTPGIVMSLYALLRNNPNPTEHDIEETFDGNLCRCTGYRPILDAAKTFCPMGENCCKNKGSKDEKNVSETMNNSLKPYDPSKEIIFPPALIARLKMEEPQELTFVSEWCTWYRPVTLKQLLHYKKQFAKEAKIVCGNTEVGIETKFKNQHYRRLIYPMDIPDLQEITYHDDVVEFGACLTLTTFMKELRDIIKKYPSSKTKAFSAILSNLKWFAGNQIRNVATIAGNIVTASPISDLNPVFVATNCKLKMLEEGSKIQEINMIDFFLGYRKTALSHTAIVFKIVVPFTKEDEYVVAYKQAKRRDDDIAIVTTGMRVKLDENDQIVDSCFAFGGMGPTTVSAKKTSALIRGMKWNPDVIDKVAETFTFEDMMLPASVPGGMAEYRRSLACSFFFKFYYHVLHERQQHIDEIDRSILDDKSRLISRGSQIKYESEGVATVGKSVVHMSALKQVTGEAIYTDDIPVMHRELYAGLVLSSKAHANIISVDPSAALKISGVKAFISHKDVIGDNIIGPVFKDEELFATDRVYFAGQMIGIIVAEDQFHAQVAAKLVKIEYEELPTILTIEDAIAQGSFFPIEKEMKRGNLEDGFTQSDHIIEGEIRIGGQEHFYLETQASIVIPKWDNDEYEIIASTQNPTETQHLVAHVLGIPSHRVVCKVKRMGGGFGGKETRSVPLSCALAVAAQKFGVAVRCMLDRDEDMMLSGQRHPFLGRYKVGFSTDGKIQALETNLFSNAGYSADLSIAVMERAVSHSDNVYFIPNIKVHGKVCKTNTHSNTAFRGFGGPQGMLITETWITHVAEFLKSPIHEIKALNMYKEGQCTHFNQPLEHFQVPRLWNELITSSNYQSRLKLVEEFNSKNNWKKRGIAILPTKFGIAFTARFLNQAGALVHIYTDGSVLVTHSGTEMGQGLHTKMAQIAADVFHIPVSQVHISDTSTDKVPNTSPTAASASSDLNGMAVFDACIQIQSRLQPYADKNPDASFKDVVGMAYMDRINLSANGFYKTPDLSYNWDTNSGRLFNYFTFGVAVSEVELDTLTGDFQVLRSDVAMDLGKSINPTIDIGQIEGAFVQGMGWSTIEETVFLQNGQLFTRGPGAYKIPGFTDIPIEFNINLLSNSENPRAVHSSKAVGEPPLLLGASVYQALREAVKSKRKDEGLDGYFRLDSPATPERLRLACIDQFTKLAGKIRPKQDEKEWAVRV